MRSFPCPPGGRGRDVGALRLTSTTPWRKNLNPGGGPGIQ